MERGKKLKIVLVSNTYSPSPIMLVIHEMIKEKGHDSFYIHIPIYKSDFPDEFYENITREITPLCKDADLIAFTCMTHTFQAMAKFITGLRKTVGNVPIAVGGIHSTAKPEECLEYADFACIGEGETAFMELIDRIAEGRNTSDIKGFYVKMKDGTILKNPQGDLVKNLDELPIPSFDLRTQYYIFDGKLICMEDYKNNQEMLQQYFTRYYFMVTSRGCPYTCKFCVNDVLKKLSLQYRVIRRRSNEHIMKELRLVKGLLKYPLIIGFADDDFFAQPVEKLQEFGRMYKEEIGNIPFFCSSTPHSMHEEKMKAAVEAGLHRLEIGIQSINDQTNWGIYGRAGLKKDVVRAINIVAPYRYKVTLNFDIIIDNPWESEESVLETLRFMFEIPKPCFFAIFSLLPFPGTSLYDKGQADGTLIDQQKQIYGSDIMIIKNNAINTLMVLYSKFNVPESVIKAGISMRNIPPFSFLFKYSTLPLWRLYAYQEGLKISLKDKNYIAVQHYLKAPLIKFKKMVEKTVVGLKHFLFI